MAEDFWRSLRAPEGLPLGGGLVEEPPETPQRTSDLAEPLGGLRRTSGLAEAREAVQFGAGAKPEGPGRSPEGQSPSRVRQNNRTSRHWRVHAVGARGELPKEYIYRIHRLALGVLKSFVNLQTPSPTLGGLEAQSSP